eukprot:scaffold6708_cov134-Cylindrotheca_fusiformis.AAC.24
MRPGFLQQEYHYQSEPNFTIAMVLPSNEDEMTMMANSKKQAYEQEMLRSRRDLEDPKSRQLQKAVAAATSASRRRRQQQHLYRNVPLNRVETEPRENLPSVNNIRNLSSRNFRQKDEAVELITPETVEEKFLNRPALLDASDTLNTTTSSSNTELHRNHKESLLSSPSIALQYQQQREDDEELSRLKDAAIQGGILGLPSDSDSDEDFVFTDQSSTYSPATPLSAPSPSFRDEALQLLDSSPSRQQRSFIDANETPASPFRQPNYNQHQEEALKPLGPLPSRRQVIFTGPNENPASPCREPSSNQYEEEALKLLGPSPSRRQRHVIAAGENPASPFRQPSSNQHAVLQQLGASPSRRQRSFIDANETPASPFRQSISNQHHANSHERAPDEAANSMEQHQEEKSETIQRNRTTSSELSKEPATFKDEDLPYEKHAYMDSSTRCWAWMRRHRVKLVVFLLVLATIAISIGLRSALQSKNDSSSVKLDVTNPPSDLNPSTTETPSVAPTMAASRLPTQSLSPRPTPSRPTPSRPTPSPSLRPTPSPSATIQEDDDFVGLSRPDLFFELVSSVSEPQTLFDTGSPQYRAFTWLVETDTVFLSTIVYEQSFYEMVRERYILALLYYSTTGSSWRNQYFLKRDVSVCEWNDGGKGSVTEGVACSDTGEVNEVVLDVNQLDGPIPSELGFLTALEKLGLGSNSLTGSIPTELGNLVKLTNLRVQMNYLVGSLPSELGQLTKLKGLVACKSTLRLAYPGNCCRSDSTCCFQRLDNNAFNGSIPTSFQSLTSLSVLFLEATGLTGSFDKALCSSNRSPYDLFYANCGGASALVASCSCCTHCCLGDGIGCQKQVTTKSNLGHR